MGAGLERAHVEVTGQLGGSWFFSLHDMGSRDRTQHVSLRQAPLPAEPSRLSTKCLTYITSSLHPRLQSSDRKTYDPHPSPSLIADILLPQSTCLSTSLVGRHLLPHVHCSQHQNYHINTGALKTNVRTRVVEHIVSWKPNL